MAPTHEGDSDKALGFPPGGRSRVEQALHDFVVRRRELQAWEFSAGHPAEPARFGRIDLVDRRTNRLVWRGWAAGSIEGLIDDQAWLEKRIDETVARIMLRLPEM